MKGREDWGRGLLKDFSLPDALGMSGVCTLDCPLLPSLQQPIKYVWVLMPFKKQKEGAEDIIRGCSSYINEDFPHVIRSNAIGGGMLRKLPRTGASHISVWGAATQRAKGGCIDGGRGEAGRVAAHRNPFSFS